MPQGRKKTTLTQRKGKPTQVRLPEAPAYLDDHARQVYETLVCVLDEQGLLATTDPKLCEIYAMQYVLMARAYTELAKTPLISGADGGRLFANPLNNIISNAAQKLRQVIADMGLSPVASKLVEYRLPNTTAKSKWAGLIEEE